MSGAPTPSSLTAREADARAAVEVKTAQAAGRLEEARERFAELAREWQAERGKVPERQRVVSMMSRFEGHSSRELSAVTGLNESTVRVHLFRATRGRR